MKPGLALFMLLVGAAVSRAQQEELLKPTTLTLRPAAPPVPALKYHLLPEVRALTPGNAALLYYRAFSPEWLTHRRPEVEKQIHQWFADAAKQPSPELKWALDYKPLREIDRAARRTYCDWEITARVREEGVTLLMPDIQSFRGFAGLLALRARLEMEAGEHDRTLHTFQTGLTLARHVSDAPTLIQALVGMAIAHSMIDQIEQWIQKPGAPNLYWGLTNVPTPFIDLRKALQGERLMVDHVLPGLREAMTGAEMRPLSPVQLNAILKRWKSLVGDPREDENLEWQVRLGMVVLAVKSYPEARQALIAQGKTPEQVEALPIFQVALWHELQANDQAYDDLIKWYGLPYWQARAGMERVVQGLPGTIHRTSIGKLMAALLIPGVQRVIEGGVRVDRRLAALRCVEAIRLHAASHDGKLPSGLSEITEVPVPLDPMTGKLFEYKVTGNRATLHGPPSRDLAPHPQTIINYELTFQR